MRGYADEIAPEIDLAAAATVIEALLEALAHRNLAHSGPDRNSLLATEAARMIRSYLTARR